MDLSALILTGLQAIGIPAWALIPLSALLVLLVQKYLPNLKLPTKPVEPEPAPAPTPALPDPTTPSLTGRPLLQLLIWLLSLKGSGSVTADDVATMTLIKKELEDLEAVVKSKV